MDFQAVLNRLADESRAERQGLVLVGGWALNAYGVSRQTLDIDFVCTDDSLARWKSVLSACSYRPIYQSDLFVKFRSDQEGLFDIDFLFVEPSTLAVLSLAGMDLSVGTAVFRVPRLLDLIAMKLHALKHNAARRGGKDLADIVALVKANDLDVATESFKTLCAKYGGAGVREAIAKEVGA